MSVFGVILVRIFPHSDWIQKDTEYLSVFSPNTGKYVPEKLRIQKTSRRNFHAVLSLLYCLEATSIRLKGTVSRIMFKVGLWESSEVPKITLNWNFPNRCDIFNVKPDLIPKTTKRKARVFWNKKSKTKSTLCKI